MYRAIAQRTRQLADFAPHTITICCVYCGGDALGIVEGEGTGLCCGTTPAARSDALAVEEGETFGVIPGAVLGEVPGKAAAGAGEAAGDVAGGIAINWRCKLLSLPLRCA